MILVPLNGDSIITEGSIERKVISFSNLNESGPVVRVRSGLGGTDLETVQFKEIQKLNDLEVKVLKNDKGQNVFSTDGYVKRSSPLPQVNEVLSANVNGIETRKYKVKRIRLHVKGRLSEGMIFECEDVSDGELVDVRIRQITDIESYVFGPKAFQKLYSEYAGTTNETTV